MPVTGCLKALLICWSYYLLILKHFGICFEATVFIEWWNCFDNCIFELFIKLNFSIKLWSGLSAWNTLFIYDLSNIGVTTEKVFFYFSSSMQDRLNWFYLGFMRSYSLLPPIASSMVLNWGCEFLNDSAASFWELWDTEKLRFENWVWIFSPLFNTMKAWESFDKLDAYILIKFMKSYCSVMKMIVLVIIALKLCSVEIYISRGFLGWSFNLFIVVNHRLTQWTV